MGKKFPFHLLLAFGGQSSLSPNLQINAISPLAVGSPDELLGYTSLSSGAVTYSSSDVTKATIVQVGGSYYLHAVAAGTVTITASQAAAGSYASATSPGSATIFAFPNISGLAEYFDFTNLPSMVISGSNITQITGKQGNVSTQGTVARQPIINTSGATPYAQFNNSFMSGADFFTGVDFTILVVYRITDGTKITQCPFFIGSTPSWTGFGLLANASDLHNNSGLYYLGTGFERPAYDSGTTINQWMIQAGSHATGSNKWYNEAGALNTSIPSNTAPIDPAGTAHYIGQIVANAAGTNLYADVQAVLIYEGQKTDTEVKSLYDYFYKKKAVTPPINIVYNGDSITYGYGSVSSFPFQTYQQLTANNSRFTAISNYAVVGVDSAYVLANISQVANAYNPNTTNVYFLMIGINDLNNGTGPTSLAQYQANINGILAAVNASGTWIIVVSTIIISGLQVSNPTLMALYIQYNNWLRTLAGGNIHVIDSAAIPQFSDPSNTTYFQGDQLHLTVTGDTIEANNLSVFMNALF